MVKRLKKKYKVNENGLWTDFAKVEGEFLFGTRIFSIHNKELNYDFEQSQSNHFLK